MAIEKLLVEDAEVEGRRAGSGAWARSTRLVVLVQEGAARSDGVHRNFAVDEKTAAVKRANMAKVRRGRRKREEKSWGCALSPWCRRRGRGGWRSFELAGIVEEARR